MSAGSHDENFRQLPRRIIRKLTKQQMSSPATTAVIHINNFQSEKENEADFASSDELKITWTRKDFMAREPSTRPKPIASAQSEVVRV